MAEHSGRVGGSPSGTRGTGRVLQGQGLETFGFSRSLCTPNHAVDLVRKVPRPGTMLLGPPRHICCETASGWGRRACWEAGKLELPPRRSNTGTSTEVCEGSAMQRGSHRDVGRKREAEQGEGRGGRGVREAEQGKGGSERAGAARTRSEGAKERTMSLLLPLPPSLPRWLWSREASTPPASPKPSRKPA